MSRTKRTKIVQVYNENIRDLLNDTGDFLDLREDPIKVSTPARRHGRWLSLLGVMHTNLSNYIFCCCFLGHHSPNSVAMSPTVNSEAMCTSTECSGTRRPGMMGTLDMCVARFWIFCNETTQCGATSLPL